MFSLRSKRKKIHLKFKRIQKALQKRKGKSGEFPNAHNHIQSIVKQKSILLDFSPNV